MAEIKKPATKRAPAAHPAPHKAAAPREHKPVAAEKAAHPVRAGRYIEAVGRRKTAVARIRISAGNGKLLVNDKEAKLYFALPRLILTAMSPLEQLKLKGEFDVSAHVSGGGIHAQAEAIRLGISRAIVKKDPEWKKRLRAMGFMTRDSRMVERKKYGLLKARRRPQWAKR